MSEEFIVVSRPFEPQDLIDDLQMLIDEEPNLYLNDRRATLCMAQAYLKEHFAEDKHGRCDYCRGATYTDKPFKVITQLGREVEVQFHFCPNCGSDMRGADNAVD